MKLIVESVLWNETNVRKIAREIFMNPFYVKPFYGMYSIQLEQIYKAIKWRLA